MSEDDITLPEAQITAVKLAIIAEFQRQAPGVYFWDRADLELLTGGPAEANDDHEQADKFDMDKIAEVAIRAMNECATLILVQISWPDMKRLLLEPKVYGAPVYWAFDDEGRCHTWPLSNWEEARAAERQRALEDGDLPPGLERPEV